jgi:hypothetical protein
MRSIDESIACCQSQLRFIPTRPLREARVLALLKEATAADFAYVHLMDALGNFISGNVWPIPGPWKWAISNQVGSALIALTANSDLLLSVWTEAPGHAFILPDAVFHGSLLYHFVYRPLKEHRVIVYSYPARANGDQMGLFLTRESLERPFGERELRAADQICAAFADELNNPNPVRMFMPLHATPAEQTVALDAEFRPLAPSIYAQAVLALFYEGRREAADGTPCLPAAMESDLRAHHAAHQRLGDTRSGDYACAFSKNHLGRVLLLNLRAAPAGGHVLTLHEDLSQHARLHRIKAACRSLTRDRTTVYHCCLLLAEGVRDPEEIARRGGFPHHKPSSALRIINQARNIVAEA